ncbi:Gfo/Idh/MocA family protein [Candidatus Neomarinimicrobiota bacterium]
MDPIKLGIIGTGIAARDLHWPALMQLADKFEITTVCNRTRAKAVAFADFIGGTKVVNDADELLANPDVEAVLIAAPIHLNLDLTAAALAAGKHALVEKPLEANLDQAAKLLAISKDYPQLVKMVAEHFRYKQVFIEAGKMIRGGTIGRAYAANWTHLGHMDPANKFAQTTWRMAHQYPGGFVTDAGIHEIAALRMLFGDLEITGAQVASANPLLGAIDSFAMHFKSDNITMGNYSKFFSAVGQSENRLLILGTEGSLTVVEDQLVLAKGDQPDEIIKFDNDLGYQAEYEAFYAAIREGAPVISTFEEAYLDLETMIKAYELAAPGETLTGG